MIPNFMPLCFSLHKHLHYECHSLTGTSNWQDDNTNLRYCAEQVDKGEHDKCLQVQMGSYTGLSYQLRDMGKLWHHGKNGKLSREVCYYEAGHQYITSYSHPLRLNNQMRQNIGEDTYEPSRQSSSPHHRCPGLPLLTA